MAGDERRLAKNAKKNAWYRAYLTTESPAKRAARLARKNAWQKAYYRRNRDAILARERAARAARDVVPEAEREKQRLYAAENRERFRKRKREWRASLSGEKLARALEANRRWREKNPDRYREARRASRRRNAENNRRAYRRWYEKNREAILARKRERYQQDLERMRERARIQHGKRRKWIQAGGVNYTIGEWRALVTTWDGRCAYCGQEPVKLHPDHRTPVARGGLNSIANILPACPPCNFRKHTMTEDEFRDLLAREARSWLEDQGVFWIDVR